LVGIANPVRAPQQHLDQDVGNLFADQGQPLPRILGQVPHRDIEGGAAPTFKGEHVGQAEREAAADAHGLAGTTLSRMLSHKRGAAPGAAVRARAVDYLAAQDGESADLESTESESADAGDDALVAESVSGTGITAGAGDGANSTARVVSLPPRTGPGRPHKNTNGPGRLSAELRQRLQFLIERDPKAVRQEAGIGLELAQAAADGAMVTPVILTRLVKFLVVE
jgi:hypothetical protein